MGLLRFGCGAIAAFSGLPGLIATGFADSPHDRSIALAEQGSFFVGGRIVQGKGVYDPTKDTGSTNEGNTFWTDQMYSVSDSRQPAKISARAGPWRRRHRPCLGDHA
jgi:hypothetical protein